MKIDFISPRNPAKFDGVEDMSEYVHLKDKNKKIEIYANCRTDWVT